jgi:hypothetical protein
VLVYKRGRAGASHLIGFMIEGYQDAHERLWVPSVANVSHGSRDAVEHAIRHIEAEEAGVAAIGIERSFLPMDTTRCAPGSTASDSSTAPRCSRSCVSASGTTSS